jgi:hypothetical protein
MRAEVTFLSRMIFGIDEDGVIRASSHARFAANADRFVEVDDAVRAFEHRCRWTGSDARRVSALVAARHLMCASHLRKHAYVDVLHISPSDANRNDIFRLASRRTRMTTDAAGMVDDLGPLHAILGSMFVLDHGLKTRVNISDLECAGRVPTCWERRRFGFADSETQSAGQDRLQANPKRRRAALAAALQILLTAFQPTRYSDFGPGVCPAAFGLSESTSVSCPNPLKLSETELEFPRVFLCL